MKLGKNVFGNKCQVETIVLKKETAFAQYFEMIKDLKTCGRNKEYTVEMSGFTDDEIVEFWEKATQLVSFIYV